MGWGEVKSRLIMEIFGGEVLRVAPYVALS